MGCTSNNSDIIKVVVMEKLKAKMSLKLMKCKNDFKTVF